MINDKKTAAMNKAAMKPQKIQTTTQHHIEDAIDASEEAKKGLNIKVPALI
jgi:hypothetical protein